MNAHSTGSFGTAWNNLRAGGKDFYLSHLCPFELSVPLENDSATILVAFGHHVFTDEKEVGPAFSYRGEKRFLSAERISRSEGLPDLLRNCFASEHSRACRSQSGAKQFFMLQESDWAIFYDLRLSDMDARLFTMRIITAFTLDEISRLSVPHRNQLYRNQVILKRILNGQDLNHDLRAR